MSPIEMQLPRKILDELGLVTLWTSSRDVKLLCAQRLIRLFAYGGSTLILASYLSALGISDARIGLFMTLTLVGDVVISFVLTLFADAMGRKAVLALGSALMVASGVVFGLFANYWVLLIAAVLGVISPRYLSSLHCPSINQSVTDFPVEMRLVPSGRSKSPPWLISPIMTCSVTSSLGIPSSGLPAPLWA